jgi:hypothetical protein
MMRERTKKEVSAVCGEWLIVEVDKELSLET